MFARLVFTQRAKNERFVGMFANKLACTSLVRRLFLKHVSWDEKVSPVKINAKYADELGRLQDFIESAKAGVGVANFLEESNVVRCGVAEAQKTRRACIVVCDESITSLTRRIQEKMRVPGIAHSPRVVAISSILPECSPSEQVAVVLTRVEKLPDQAIQELKELACDSTLSKKYKVVAAVSRDCKDKALVAQKVLNLNNHQKFYQI